MLVINALEFINGRIALINKPTKTYETRHQIRPYFDENNNKIVFEVITNDNKQKEIKNSKEHLEVVNENEKTLVYIKRK